MQIFEKTCSLQAHAMTALETFKPGGREQFCFFDIETTGLSPRVSSLYLIGALWYNGASRTAHIKQWFADDYVSEKELLSSFSEFISEFTTVVHFNGSGFDIPYIEKKCGQLGLPSPFSSLHSLDIFREIRTLKTFFDVPNLKLVTVEKLVGFTRRDLLSGKDCIQVYSDFMQKKYFKDAEMELERNRLLLHNEEDLIGACLSSQLLSYRCPFSFERVREDDGAAQALFSFSGTFPLSLTRTTDAPPYTVHFAGSRIRLELTLQKGELLHFFKNYKDYYYLPAEDTAVHKSVGTYVDRQFREPAKASNCYIRKEGIFLPLPKGLVPERHLLFRADYKSKQHYLYWDETAKQDSFLMEQILNAVTSGEYTLHNRSDQVF